MAGRRCDNCEFISSHVEQYGDTYTGHKNAPTVFLQSKNENEWGRVAIWPLVEADDWCGEFKTPIEDEESAT